MRERLEEIKEIDITPLCFYLDNMTNFDGKLLKEQWKWLIKRVEALEEENDEWKDTAQSYYMTNQELREQNKRYKQALEEILNADCNLEGLDAERELDRVTDIALKALEGDK